MDPTLIEDIEKDTVEKIETVKKELAWISAKESLANEKLQRKFLDPIQTERIEVSSFQVIFVCESQLASMVERLLLSELLN